MGLEVELRYDYTCDECAGSLCLDWGVEDLLDLKQITKRLLELHWLVIADKTICTECLRQGEDPSMKAIQLVKSELKKLSEIL